MDQCHALGDAARRKQQPIRSFWVRCLLPLANHWHHDAVEVDGAGQSKDGDMGSKHREPVRNRIGGGSAGGYVALHAPGLRSFNQLHGVDSGLDRPSVFVSA